MENNLIKPITLEIDKGLWDKFKDTIPRTVTLNDAVITLIRKSIKNGFYKPLPNNQTIKEIKKNV